MDSLEFGFIEVEVETDTEIEVGKVTSRLTL